MKHARFLALLLVGCLAWTASLEAEEPPLPVGSEGVPVPKKVKNVEPRYPSEAAAQGIRGIVILDLIIDTTGAVESVRVVRSVPGLDDAAVAAASQWRYAPVEIDGRAARVRMTVPITFSLALPNLVREAGVPELRQGVTPAFPPGAQGRGRACVGVMLQSDGHIAVRGVMKASEEPWTSALLSALETWRFAPAGDDRIVSFQIEADFVAGKRPEANTVSLRATALKVVDARTAEQAPAAPVVPPAPAVAPTPTAAPTPAPPSETPRPAPVSTPPPLEVVSAPLSPPPPESGISLVRNVTLEPGVPELARGRRPVPPPLARMAGSTGTVEVAFSVGAAGITTVQRVTGPDLLTKAAEEAVASWVFRRTRANRAYLTAVFQYGDHDATARVRPAAAPTPPPSSAVPATSTQPAAPIP
jgi:TonB family protein